MKKSIKDKIILYGLSLISVINMSGCSKKPTCDIEEKHVHLYVSDNGLSKYSSCDARFLPSEYYKTDDCINVSPFEAKYCDYLSRNGFLDINLNYELLMKYFPKLPDQTQYEYVYDKLVSSKKIRDEKGNIVDIEQKYSPDFGWTFLPKDEQLTGNQRVLEYAYMGYKINYNYSINKFEYERSEYYSSIDDLINAGYTHVKIKTFTRQVDKNNVIKNEQMILTK